MSEQNGQVEIYEFSGAFRNEVFENDKWVAGGHNMSTAIYRSNYKSGKKEEIPSEIQTLITPKKNILGIPTGYAPVDNQVALIARVINNRYCILAVANYQDENTYRSSVAGYRYFWLDKESEINKNLLSMDGIGTLLNWWLKNQEEYVFDMNPNSFTGKELVCNQYLSDDSRQSNKQRDYPVYPHILELVNSGENDLIQLHNQTIQKAEEAGIPIAWAWNVRKLDFPEYYIAIWCADERAKKNIKSDLDGLDLDKNYKDNPSPTPNQTTPTKPDIHLTRKESSINDKLNTFVDCVDQGINNVNLKIDTQKAAESIVKELSKQEDWKEFFLDEHHHIINIKKNEDDQIGVFKYAVIYYALLPLLVPERIIEWLNWLRRHQNWIKISFQTQRFIYEACTQPQEKTIICNLIYEGISSLLYELLDNVNNYELCKLLFVSQKTNIWSEKLNEYVTNCVNFLLNRNSFNTEQQVYGGEITRSVFTGLSDTFRKYQQPQTKNDRWANLRWRKNISNNPGLTSLANLLHKKVNAELNPLEHLFNQHEPELLKINLLSAICYQFSEGSIPHSVFSKVDSESQTKINRILRFPPQERGASLRKWLNRIIVSGLTLGILFLLVQGFPKFLTSISQRWQSSSQPSLKESFEECRNISNDKSSETNKQIQKCEKQLKNILQSEIDKINKLNPQNEKYQATKDSIRESENYKYIMTTYINPSVANRLQNPDEDNPNKPDETYKYVLMILKYLKQSLDGRMSYDEIIQPLESCAETSEVKKFKSCISEIRGKI